MGNGDKRLYLFTFLICQFVTAYFPTAHFLRPFDPYDFIFVLVFFLFWLFRYTLEKRPFPPASPLEAAFPGRSAREGAFLKKGPLPRIPPSLLVKQLYSSQEL